VVLFFLIMQITIHLSNIRTKQFKLHVLALEIRLIREVNDLYVLN
jgi:hypothetical protein